MATLNYTTTVPVARTVGECQQLLAQAGADAVAVRYAEREPVGLSFRLETPHGPRSFTLPVHIVEVQRLLQQQEREKRFKSNPPKGGWATPEQAARVAWRVVKDWLEAQLAIIEAHMAELDQVMLPYLEVAPDRTLYEVYRERENAAIDGVQS